MNNQGRMLNLMIIHLHGHLSSFQIASSLHTRQSYSFVILSELVWFCYSGIPFHFVTEVTINNQSHISLSRLIPLFVITKDHYPRQGAEFLHFNLFLPLAY